MAGIDLSCSVRYCIPCQEPMTFDARAWLAIDVGYVIDRTPIQRVPGGIDPG